MSNYTQKEHRLLHELDKKGYSFVKIPKTLSNDKQYINTYYGNNYAVGNNETNSIAYFVNIEQIDFLMSLLILGITQ